MELGGKRFASPHLLHMFDMGLIWVNLPHLTLHANRPQIILLACLFPFCVFM
jgi:hypothetical protein